MLALGCKSTIKINNGKILEYDLDYILSNLNISYMQFIDMCILFGCDYLKHPLKLETDEIYNLILKYKSLEGILEESNHEILNINNYKCKGLYERYYNVKNIYINSKHNEILDVNLNINMQVININNIINYLEKINFFNTFNKSKHNIICSLNYINNHIKLELFNY